MSKTVTRQRQRDLEALAQSLLQQSTRISAYQLADRAKINFFLARGVLRGLANRGLATELSSGSFCQAPQAKTPHAVSE
jgi:ribosomal protein S25